jgi:hypothetical protein
MFIWVLSSTLPWLKISDADSWWYDIRTFFASAVDTLLLCEGQSGAVARSKFALADVLKELGEFDAADKILSEVQDTLSTFAGPLDVRALSNEHFERYVLFCHR